MNKIPIHVDCGIISKMFQCLYLTNANKGIGEERPMIELQIRCYVFLVMCSLDVRVDIFIHVPRISFNELKYVFESDMLK